MLWVVTAMYTYWSHWGWSGPFLNLRTVFSFWWVHFIMPLVCACLMVASFMLMPACSIVYFTTSAPNVVLLSISMLFGTHACLVKMDIGLFTTDGASGALKGISNMYLEKALFAVRESCVKPLDGWLELVLLNRTPTGLLVHCSGRRYSAMAVVSVNWRCVSAWYTSGGWWWTLVPWWLS